MNDTTKHIGDGSAILLMATTFAGYLPDVAAGLSVIWLALRCLNEWHAWKMRRRK